MATSDWTKMQALFDRALDSDDAGRRALLKGLKESDSHAYQEVSALLKANDLNGDFTGNLGIASIVADIGPSFEGRTIGPYVVESEIGRGAMGVVYKACDTRLDRNVALKFLAGSLAATDAARVRFYGEAKAVSRLDHANICTIFDIGESDEGALYIAMAYYDGQTLNTHIADTPVTLRDAIQWTTQIAEGLQFAHSKGVVHRDVKAANVFLTIDKQIKILDFGVAKLRGIDVTGPGLRMGTMAYMSPEQLTGGKVDHRADIWSLGVVLYEVLAGKKPFRGESSSDIANQILRADIVPVAAIETWLPPIADKIIARCLSRDLDERYKDLGEMLADVENFRNLVTVDTRLSARLLGNPNDDARQASEFTHFSELESRQITVVSCVMRPDASGSVPTPEHAAERALQMQQQCESFALSEGIAFTHNSDSIIALCFGYPRSEEDNTTRALRAAVALRQELQASAAAGAEQELFEFSFGIHTGDAIVDGTGATSRGFVQRLQGDVSAVANDIQALANAGDIVVSQTTAAILHDQKGLDNIGNVSVTGSSRGISVHRLSGEPLDIGIPHSALDGDSGTLVGRVSEQAILSECWRSVLDGEGQIVTIGGEAGIGKSRLLRRASSRAVCPDAKTVIRLHCSAYHQHSFLYPFTEWLRSAFALLSADAPSEESQQLLRRFLQQRGLLNTRRYHLLARLLGIDTLDAEDGKLAMTTPEMRRDYTLQALVEIIAQYTTSAPILIIVEDLHWADASSLELIRRLVDQGPESRFLLLLSYRPSFSAEWLARSHVLSLTLGKLSQTDSRALVRYRFGNIDVPADLMRQIAEKSDGIPLFIEELCTMLRATATLQKSADAKNNNGLFDQLTIPKTLRDSLAARLDRNTEFKPVAQLASVLGRKFGYQMISKTWTGEPAVLDAGLNYLVKAELLFQSGAIPNAKYVFKHALIQDAAYSSLIKSARAKYHRLAVDVIERFFPAMVKQQPEVVATHYSRAEMPERAVHHWLAAASDALQQSALVEAIAHARNGLLELTTHPEGAEKLQLELQLLMTLGPALMAHHSWSTPDVSRSYERAREICTLLGNVPELFPVLYGLYTYHCVVGDHDAGQSLNQLCLRVAKSANDDGLQLEASMLQGMTHFFFAEFSSAQDVLRRVAAAYEPTKYGDHCYLYGQDPGMVTNSYLALTLALRGHSDAAREVSTRSLEQTRALQHPFSLAYGLTFAAWLHLLLGDNDQGRQLADEAQVLCVRQRIGIMRGMSRILIGQSEYNEQRFVQAKADICDGIQQFDELGAGVLMPNWYGLLSEVELAGGDAESALRSVTIALDWAKRSKERWADAELYRIKARVLRQAPNGHDSANGDFERAIDLAASQGAKLFELRARSDRPD